ncbi:MAG: LysR family transcriptional regulator [Peptococcaceae bacterium]
MMRIDQLRAMVHIAKIGSISHTAEILHMSQQGLSYTIKSLENELGGIIFERKSNNLILTHEGKLAIEIAKEILKKYDEMLELFSPDLSSEAGTAKELSILTTHLLSKTILQKTVLAFYKRNPQVALNVIELPAYELIKEFKNKNNTIGLLCIRKYAFDDLDENDKKDLNFDILCKCEVFASIAPNSPLAKRKFVTPNELIKYPIVVFNAQQHIKTIHKMFESVGEPNIKIKTANWDFDFYQEIIGSGLAIGISHGLSKSYEKKGLFVNIPIKTKIDFELLIVYITFKDTLLSPTAKKFVKTLKTISLKEYSF